MKMYRFVVVLCLFFLSCDQKTKVEKEVEEIPVDIKVERFDKVFFETKPEDLAKVKKQYPFFFPEGNDDNVWLQKMKEPIWREVYDEVQKKYANFEPVREEFNELFKHVKYYFPKTKTPKVITVIGEMDYNAKAIYADSLVIVALELYLGREHKFYEFPNYLKYNFEERQIMPDVVSSFTYRNIPSYPDKNLISQMIFEGKQLYAKDLLLPQYTDAEKIGYKPEQIKWCEENESYMWRYFLENEMLYSLDPKLTTRFIVPAPFSKFYLEIDNDSPGRVGAWIGWQIVRSYMKNNNVLLSELLKVNAKEIFEKSKYKPKK
ncbi:gliding motility lipoprotein GldB [Flavobacterium johnsoniae]|uniref:GldB n=2 Tax=Flavobacterium johnsoniae TaxID=986 RepID=Q9WWY2_FLAJO|nr:gliding motility lipoprotein GldB [Flavobacterium johnsoniae]AAD42888.1 GldB [Flavobacterium johnsoniae UW101]ABQ04825.1 GldB [Flavobacterium johnsoniae UW101]OXG02974.1 gliding motility lipoprotein GldB [Flavobacterium johnsoniae UW101]WQG83377.1 gliding motility lipoprotein GldB [Flavobacterium johnsoniae UW101]